MAPQGIDNAACLHVMLPQHAREHAEHACWPSNWGHVSPNKHSSRRQPTAQSSMDVQQISQIHKQKGEQSASSLQDVPLQASRTIHAQSYDLRHLRNTACGHDDDDDDNDDDASPTALYFSSSSSICPAILGKGSRPCASQKKSPSPTWQRSAHVRHSMQGHDLPTDDALCAAPYHSHGLTRCTGRVAVFLPKYIPLLSARSLLWDDLI